MKKVRLTYQSELHFFGLTPENKEVILEQIFVLMNNLNFNYKDAYNLPVWKRFWFIQKLKENLEKQNNVNQNPKSLNNSKNIFKKSF